MPRILENLDDLDRMVDTNAGKSDIRFQIDLISKQVAAFEADYENLVAQHADLEEEHSKLKQAHSELQATKSEPTAKTPRQKASDLENIQQNILFFLFNNGAKATHLEVGMKFFLPEQLALSHLEKLEEAALVEREIVGGSSIFPERRQNIFPDKWGLSADGRRCVVESGR